jgi:hypothetical protein
VRRLARELSDARLQLAHGLGDDGHRALHAAIASIADALHVAACP